MTRNYQIKISAESTAIYVSKSRYEKALASYKAGAKLIDVQHINDEDAEYQTMYEVPAASILYFKWSDGD